MDNKKPCTSSKSDKAIRDYEKRKRRQNFQIFKELDVLSGKISNYYSKSDTFFLIITGLFYLLFPFYTALIGIFNFGKCPVNQQIPIWIFLNSIIICLFGLFLIFKRFIKIDRIFQMSLLMLGWAVFGLTILLQQIDKVDFNNSNKNQDSCSQNLYLTSLTSSIFELTISLFYFFQSIDNNSIKKINHQKQKSLKIYNPRV